MSNAANGSRAMTLKQKQALLSYLGYYDGPIDGIWGGKSQRATIDFQRDCMDSTNGIFGAATQARILEVIVSGMPPKEAPPDWWQEIRHFRREEFRCPCGRCGGFPVEPEETLVRLMGCGSTSGRRRWSPAGCGARRTTMRCPVPCQTAAI